MRACLNCGRIIDEGETFCENCGTNINVETGRCQRCGKEAGPNDVFCGSCGAPLRTSEYHDDRVAEIKDTLNDLYNDGGEDSYVIFENPATKKFVQFMYANGNIVVDVPKVELTDEEANRVSLLLDSVATAENSPEMVSYQKSFTPDAIDEASEMVERIFIHVFKLSYDYKIETENEI